MSVLPQSLTQETVRERIRELGDWFWNMELMGVPTAPDHFSGDYPRVKWERFSHAIPKDLTGKSVLDVGCNAGFYSIEMKRRGASRVLGIDHSKKYLEQAKFAAAVTGVEVEFRNVDVYAVGELKERFDLVIFMGVLYHLRHPLLALDLLHQHSVDDLLIVQSLLRGNSATPSLKEDYPITETQIFDTPGFPIMHFIGQRYSSDPAPPL